MNDITKFTSSSANSYAEIVEKNQLDEANKRASALIKYIEKRYEKAVKKAINESKTASRTKISLPYTKRIRKTEMYNLVEEIVNEHFKKLGFDVTFRKGNYCSCLFDFICNSDSFEAVIRWL
jgi:ribosomal protein L17